METSSVSATLGALPRRAVVVGGAAAAVTLAFADSASAALRAKAPGRARWEKLVGEKFTATLDGRKVTLRLDAVRDASFRPARASKKKLAKWRRKAYTLQFSTRGGLEQGAWMLRHRRTGRFELFVVPDRRVTGKRTAVTATFNGWKG